MIPIPPSITLKGIWAALIALAFAIVLALLAVQTIRLEGFKLWPFSYEGALPKIERYETAFKDIERTTRETTEAWKRAIDLKEQTYRDKAKEADENAQEALSGAMDAAERHIAANRVQCPGNRSGVVGPAPDAGSDSASGDNGSSGAPELVAVTPDDVRICTTNTIRLEAARAWAQRLEAP